MQNRCYWNAWRVLAAGGSRLEDATAQAVLPEVLLNGAGWDGAVRAEQGPNATAQFSGMMVLPGQAEQSYRLEWSLPTRVAYQSDPGWVYTLKLQKQGSRCRAARHRACPGPTRDGPLGSGLDRARRWALAVAGHRQRTSQL